MKKLVLWIIAFAALAGGPLFAQSIAGTWQGTIQVGGKEFRMVIKISTTDADALKAVLYSIDQGGQGLPATTTTLQGSTVKISIVGIGGRYEGKLSADENSITGTWTQVGPPMALNLKRATNETVWAIPEPPPPLKPLAADINPVFEVATIKPSKPTAQGKLLTMKGSQFSTLNTSVNDLISFAYDLHARQIAGGPSWLDSDKYDILAQPEGTGSPNRKQLSVMVQKLLADRFKLSFHREKKELAVYAIVVAKTGSKLTKSEGDPNALPSLPFRGLGLLPARNATIADFALVMQAAVLDRPVVDQTGLTGKYDFTLKWTPDESQFGGLGARVQPSTTDKADAPPDLFIAIEQQLGLRLEPTKAPVEVIAVDHVEKPSEN